MCAVDGHAAYAGLATLKVHPSGAYGLTVFDGYGVSGYGIVLVEFYFRWDGLLVNEDTEADGYRRFHVLFGFD